MRHRRYQNLTLGLFVGWIPFGFLVGSVTINWLRLPPLWVFIPIGIYVIVLVVVANIYAAFRCPNCGHRFYAWGPYGLGYNSFARKCRNCGLRKWHCAEGEGSNQS